MSDESAHPTPWHPGPDLDAVVRALQDPTRRRILLAFYDDPSARTVDEVAALAGVHRTVAFGHLELLTSLGYLAAGRRRGHLGKPAKLYRLAAPPISLQHPRRRFSELAATLAATLDRIGPSAREATYDSGFAEGRRMAAGARTLADALERLDHIGADFELAGDRVTAHTCVFLEACSRARPVVCGLQAGLVAGAAAAAGEHVAVEPQGPTPDGRGCTYTLRRPL